MMKTQRRMRSLSKEERENEKDIYGPGIEIIRFSAEKVLTDSAVVPEQIRAIQRKRMSMRI